MTTESYEKYIQELEQQSENNNKQIQNKIAQKKYFKKGLLARFKTLISAERTEEKIKYKIEYEKYKIRNRAICLAIHHLEKKEEELTSLSKKHNIIPKATVSNKNEQQQKVKELTTILEETLQELYILITKQILNEETKQLRDKQTFILNTLINSLIGAFFTLITIGMPTSLVLQALGTSLNALVIVASPLIGGIGMYTYTTKMKKATMKAFHNLNKNLNEFALSTNIQNDIGKELSRNSFEIERKREQITNLYVQLAEEKMILESYEVSENQITQTLHPTMHQTFTYEIEEKEEEKGKTFILRRNSKAH